MILYMVLDPAIDPADYEDVSVPVGALHIVVCSTPAMVDKLTTAHGIGVDTKWWTSKSGGCVQARAPRRRGWSLSGGKLLLLLLLLRRRRSQRSWRIRRTGKAAAPQPGLARRGRLRRRRGTAGVGIPWTSSARGSG